MNPFNSEILDHILNNPSTDKEKLLVFEIYHLQRVIEELREELERIDEESYGVIPMSE